MEQQISALLEELAQVQEELLSVLTEKRNLMAANKLQEMQALQPREAELNERLQNCTAQREELLQEAGRRGLPSDSIGQLAAALPGDEPKVMQGKVKSASSRMRLLQHHSLTNWVLAQKSLLHISQMLEIVATGGQLQPTYKKGESAPVSGSFLDQEV